ncbi:MAG: ATP-grasp fold amidoligase family protein [Oscillospiraceae bacterium]|nr:ATP-grasp fold amidoligase family protein [Oscillospiraceae bacterium]
MLQLQYRVKFGRKLNLKAPERFTEKIQWYKLHYKNELMPQCSDKYMVREYVKAKGLGHILNELYCVFDRPEDIKLDQLPEKFVMKLSNGSGTNLLCTDKSKLVESEVIQEFKQFVFKVKANLGREWPYMKTKPVIIAEKLLEDETHINNTVNDYKIFCYDGKPEYIICISDRYSDRCNHLVYDTEWSKIRVASEDARIDEDAPKPETLQDMLDIAAKLSEDFSFARIDLYSLGEKVYFGEITFYPWSGYMEFEPDEFDYILGKKFVLKKS